MGGSLPSFKKEKTEKELEKSEYNLAINHGFHLNINSLLYCPSTKKYQHIPLTLILDLCI